MQKEETKAVYTGEAEIAYRKWRTGADTFMLTPAIAFHEGHAARDEEIKALTERAERAETERDKLRLRFECFAPQNDWPNSEGGKCPFCPASLSVLIDKDGLKVVECNDCTFSILQEDFKLAGDPVRKMEE